VNEKPKYWFAATVTFKCPKCGKTSSEVMHLQSTTVEPPRLNAAIETQRPKCSWCKYVLNESDDGTQIGVQVVPIPEPPQKHK
jgi:transposase-like protein